MEYLKERMVDIFNGEMKIRRFYRGLLAGAFVLTECYCLINSIPVSEGFHALTIIVVMFYFKKEEEEEENDK